MSARDYPGRDPYKDPIVQSEYLAVMRDAERWPRRAFGVPAGTGCALVNHKTGQHGLIVNVPWRDRLTVYEAGVFDNAAMDRIYNTPLPSGVPEHKFTSFEDMYDAGWRPD